MDEKDRTLGVWIPRAIWTDDRLDLIDKVLFAEIVNLDDGDGCFATNEWFAKFCGCSVRTIKRSVCKLIALGYVAPGKFNGRSRRLKIVSAPRQIGQNGPADGPNCHGRDDKMAHQIGQNGPADGPNCHGDIMYNNIYNNISIICAAVVAYLNRKAGTQYDPDDAETVRPIAERIEEGHTEEEFRAVIDKKTSEWVGTKMRTYLRPSTLFGKRFALYLAEPTTEQPIQAGSFDTDEFFEAAIRKGLEDKKTK